MTFKDVMKGFGEVALNLGLGSVFLFWYLGLGIGFSIILIKIFDKINFFAFSLKELFITYPIMFLFFIMVNTFLIMNIFSMMRGK